MGGLRTFSYHVGVCSKLPGVIGGKRMFIAMLSSIILLAQADIPNSQLDGAILARRMKEAVPKAKAELQQCYRNNAIRLGVGNVETADTLLRGIRSICEPIEAKLTNLYVPEIQGRSAVANLVARDRRDPEDKAVAALLEERAALKR